MAKVPDHRLDLLAEMSASANVVHAAVQFTDIGGLVEGASQGEGLGNAFLVAHPRGRRHRLRAPGLPRHRRARPVGSARATAGRRDRARARRPGHGREAVRQDEPHAARATPRSKPIVALLERCVENLGEGTPLYRAELTDDDRVELKEFFFLTNKPVMAVLNIGEDQIGAEDEIAAPVRAELDGAEVVPLCVQLEAEAAQLDGDEREEMLEALGLGEGALPAFLKAAYHLLGLRTFLTTGEKESRAWTFRAGSTAPECAGVIHTDFERGFIRAETIQWDDLLEIGSWHAARDDRQAPLRGQGLRGRRR